MDVKSQLADNKRTDAMDLLFGDHPRDFAGAMKEYDFAIGGGLANVAKEGAIVAYSALKPTLKGVGEEAHHLIEKRFAGKIGEKAGGMLSTAVTKAEHQGFTNQWRALIPYRKGTASATRDSIMAAAAKIYVEHPVIMRALGLM